MKLSLFLLLTLFTLSAQAIPNKATITFNRDFETNDYFREGRRYAFNDNQLFRAGDQPRKDGEAICSFSIIAEKSGTRILKGSQLTYDSSVRKSSLDRVDQDDRTPVESFGGGFGISLQERYDTTVGIAGTMRVLNKDGVEEEQEVIATAFCSILTPWPIIGRYWIPTRNAMIRKLQPYFTYTESR